MVGVDNDDPVVVAVIVLPSSKVGGRACAERKIPTTVFQPIYQGHMADRGPIGPVWRAYLAQTKPIE